MKKLFSQGVIPCDYISEYRFLYEHIFIFLNSNFKKVEVLILLLVGSLESVSRRLLLPLAVTKEGDHWQIAYVKASFVLVMWTGPMMEKER